MFVCLYDFLLCQIHIKYVKQYKQYKYKNQCILSSVFSEIKMVFNFKDTPQYFIIHAFVLFFKRLFSILFGRNKQIVVKSNLPNSEEIQNAYIQKHKEKFLRCFDKTDEIKYYNDNISVLFYDAEKYKEEMEIYENETEKEWKRRVLMENTPRGNVIMYYDPYKMGFSFFSDNYIPYPILNAVAMKYVVMYRCLHFFMDEHILPKEHITPFIRLYKIEEKKKCATNDGKATHPNHPIHSAQSSSILSNSLKSAPLAKFKSYNKPGSVRSSYASSNQNNIKKEYMDKPRKEEIQKNKWIMNTFVYLGKVSNFSIIQKTPKKNKLNGFHTSLLPSKKMSWSDYKQKMNANNQTIREPDITSEFIQTHNTQRTKLFMEDEVVDVESSDSDNDSNLELELSVD